jgi:nucleoside-diphosphate-sugar epimerase
MKQKLVILGATGFIGRNLADYFVQKPQYEVYGTYFRSRPLEHPGIRMIQADLTRAEDVERALAGMDLVLQAAAVTSGAGDAATTPQMHITDNAIMNSLIFRAAHELSVSRLVFFSCSVMYQDRETPQKESDFDANREMFPNYFGGAWNKIYFEKLCEFYSRLGRTRYTVVRHSNVYGPYDKFDLKRSHVFGATIAKVAGSRDGTLTLWGSGEEKRDLLHVDDLVDFVERALERQQAPFSLYNAGSGRAVSVRELAQCIISAAGRELAIVCDLSKPTMKINITLDSNKALSELGWQARVPLEEGVARVLAWYREHHGKAAAAGGTT